MTSDKVRVRMVLYRMHDYDLVDYATSLKDRTCGNPRISFTSVTEALLRQYCTGQEFKVPVLKAHTNQKLPSRIAIRFVLDKQKDKEILETLEKVKPRQKNSFLKSLIRRYMTVDGLESYFAENTTPVLQKNEVKEEIKVVQPKVVKPKTQPKKESPKPEEPSGFDFFGALGDITI